MVPSGAMSHLLQASTLDGVLELKREHFWTIAFGSYVS